MRIRPAARGRLVVGLLVLLASRTRAQAATDPHAVQPERPTVATHAGTVATGWLEIETGVERDRIAPDQVSLGVPTVLKFGVGRTLQLSVFLPIVSPASTAAGLGDVAVGLKWRLGDEIPVLREFAILPSVKFSSGSLSAGRGTSTTDASLLFISSRTVGSVSIDLNAGITVRSGGGKYAPTTSTVWTASVGFPISGPLGWAAECFGFPATSGPAGADGTVALLFGPTYQIKPWLTVDAGIIAPLRGPQPKALYAGLVWNAGRFWPAARSTVR